MVKIWAALLVMAALPSPVWACRLALVLALDTSASVDAQEFATQRAGLASALIAPEVQAAFLSTPEPVALSAFVWSGQWNQSVVLDWRLIQGRADLLDAAETLARMERADGAAPTALGSALGFAAGVLRDGPRCDRQTVDVSADGENNHGYAPRVAYRHFPLAGVTVNALAIGGAADLSDLVDYYQSEVIQGPGAFVQTARDYEDFERAMRRKLEREVSVSLAARQ